VVDLFCALSGRLGAQVGLAAGIFATLNRFGSTDLFFIIQP
jgi:hypothetical protein